MKDKMAIGNSHTLIIIQNVSGLNSPIRKHRVVRMTHKTKPNHMLPPGDMSQLQE